MKYEYNGPTVYDPFKDKIDPIRDTFSAYDVLVLCCEQMGTNTTDALSGSKKRERQMARAMTMYIMCAKFGARFCEFELPFGLTNATVSHNVRSIEREIELYDVTRLKVQSVLDKLTK